MRRFTGYVCDGLPFPLIPGLTALGDQLLVFLPFLPIASLFEAEPLLRFLIFYSNKCADKHCMLARKLPGPVTRDTAQC